jgi:ribosomal-protein-alanine N-acetyltransferase
MAGKSFEIRDALQEDLSAIFDIEKRSFPDPYPKTLLKAFLFLPGAYVVTTLDGMVVGYAIGVIRHLSLGHVISIAISPFYRRSGAGERLLIELIERLKKIGAKEITLEVRETNSAAIELYRKLGFFEKRKLSGYYPDGETALEMRLSLK